MSSSNLVSLRFIEETTYGETPASGDFSTARFTSEGLSGTPETVESQQIRTDRMSSGQVVTGLTVGGDLAFELAKESQLEAFMASAMYNSWNVKSETTVGLTINTAAKTITRDSGDWAADGYVVGDFCLLTAADAANDVTIMIAEIVSATVIRYVGPTGMVDGAATAIKRHDKLTIGTTKKSFSMEKAFTDLTNKAIIYRGMIVASMELNVAFGELISGTLSFSGNDYLTVDAANEFITDGRTIQPPATTDTLNGSIDMPFLGSSATGALDASGLDIQSVSLTLNNNLSAQNVIGDIAPKDYSPGTAAIEINLSAYLKDAAWGMLAKKLTQEAFALGFMVKNLGGGYGFYLPAIQVSFEDPASGGQNQDILLEMTGTAKVGSSGESAMSLYRIPA